MTKPMSKKEQEEFDAKVRDLWRRLDLSQLADIEDLPASSDSENSNVSADAENEHSKKRLKGKLRGEVDREIEAEWIRENLK
jgi:hypothetical protein